MSKVVVGIVAEIFAGKNAVADLLEKKITAVGFSVARMGFSDILRETLREWGVETTRENLQKIAQVFNREFGAGTLARAVENRIRSAPADVVIVDGVRWKEDEELIRSFEKNLLVYVTAPMKDRFNRRARGQNAGEKDITWEQFQKQHEAPNEVLISEIGDRADVVVHNPDGEKELLTHKAHKVFWEALPLLTSLKEEKANA